MSNKIDAPAQFAQGDYAQVGWFPVVLRLSDKLQHPCVGTPALTQLANHIGVEEEHAIARSVENTSRRTILSTSKILI